MKKCIFLLAVTLAPTASVFPQASTKKASSNLEPRAKASLAVIRGTHKAPGLQQTVRVQRDRWEVPHIYAQNEHDLFFAQGFVVAQDRLFQMELWKRSGEGRLAEILGPSVVQRDVNARLLRYRGDMDAEFKSYAPDTKQILEAFTSGINAYIEEIQKPGGIGLPLEFQLAGFKPEVWKPEDCLNRLAAYSMTGNGASELLHAQLVALLGAEKASELFEFDPCGKSSILLLGWISVASRPSCSKIVGSDVPSISRDACSGQQQLDRLRLSHVDRQASLANDPHRVIAEPSLRYIVHLVAPGWNVIGAGEPGLPGVARPQRKYRMGFTILASTSGISISRN
jgi:penicillin amidase